MKLSTVIFLCAVAILSNANGGEGATTKNNVADFILTVQDLTNRFNATANSTNQEDLDILTALEGVQLSAENLQLVADGLDQLQKSNELKNDADDTKDSWDDWATVTLRKAARKYGRNSHKYALIEFDVNELPSYYGSRLDSCIRSLTKDLRSQQSSIDSSISKSLVTIKNLLLVQQNCLASPSTQCTQNVQTQLAKVQTIPAELDALTVNGNGFLNTSYEDRTCVKKTLNGFNQEKNNIASGL